MSLDTSASSLRRLAEQRLDTLRSSASTFTTPLQRTSHMEMRTFLTTFYESIWTAEKRKFYDCEMQQYPRLKELYQELVVIQKKLTYEDFWQRYEYRCDISRVIHGILQRDDPDWMKTVMDDAQTKRTTTLSHQYSSKRLQQVRNNATSLNPTTSNRTNLACNSLITERPMVETSESKMDNSDNTDSLVVNGNVCKGGVRGTEHVDATNLQMAEPSPSPSAGDEPSLLLEDEKEVVASSSLECSVNECHVNGSPNRSADRSGREVTLTRIDGVKKNSNVTVVFMMKCALVVSILVASLVGLAAFVLLRDGGIDTLCAPIRPGLDVAILDIGNSTRYSAPWWSPEEQKEMYFSVLCAPMGMVRTEILVDWNAKKRRFMGISIVDLDKDQSLLTLKQLRSFQLLPETLQLRAETTRGRVTVHPAPWSKSSNVL